MNSYSGYLSLEDQEKTNLKHGEISVLPFGLPQSKKAEFNIFLVARDAESPAAVTELLDCKMLLDHTAGPLPVNPQIWTDKIVYLSDTPDNQTVLSNYRIFWKSGASAPIE